MKKLCKILLLLTVFTSVLGLNIASAQVQFGVSEKINHKVIYISFFNDYYPIGQYKSNFYSGLFDAFLDDFKKKTDASYDEYWNQGYEATVRTGAKGRCDILLGMYADTALYGDWKFIYPAALDNPVHLVMMPERVREVKSIDDLKSMKGAVDAREQWSDFVREQINSFNVETIDNSYELYGKLMRGEIDYIFTTYWFGMTEMMKLGISEMLSVSRKSLWNMPLFIGVSKASRERDYLVHALTKSLEDEEVRNKIKARAFEILEEVKQENAGVVPPSYTLETEPTSEIKTSHDESSDKNN